MCRRTESDEERHARTCIKIWFDVFHRNANKLFADLEILTEIGPTIYRVGPVVYQTTRLFIVIGGDNGSPPPTPLHLAAYSKFILVVSRADSFLSVSFRLSEQQQQQQRRRRRLANTAYRKE